MSQLRLNLGQPRSLPPRTILALLTLSAALVILSLASWRVFAQANTGPLAEPPGNTISGDLVDDRRVTTLESALFEFPNW